METISAPYSHAWRNCRPTDPWLLRDTLGGILIALMTADGVIIGFNDIKMIGSLFFYWLARLPKGARNTKKDKKE